jgi:hypothetical protein
MPRTGSRDVLARISHRQRASWRNSCRMVAYPPNPVIACQAPD